MPATWRTVRVFISSTFSDMHAERDHLVKVVFPSLRERLEKYRIHLVDIDLRWGVTREQADNDRSLDLCLQQIDECRPFFIGILGERYGYIPRRVSLTDSPRYGWVQETTGKSITELEIMHGVLNDRQMRPRSYFFFRDRSFLQRVPVAKRAEMLSDSAESAGKLADLKQAIRNANVPVFEDYPCVYLGLKVDWRLTRQKLAADQRRQLEQLAGDGIFRPIEYESLDRELRAFINEESVVYLGGLGLFGQAVSDQLWEAIRDEHDFAETPPAVTLAAPDALAEEADYHERFMESRLRVYVGRQATQHALVQYAEGDYAVPCLVSGPSGSGKSAALAKFVAAYEQTRQDILVISHFVGASPASTVLRQVLHRFCSILKREFFFEDELPPDTDALSRQFAQFVTQAPDERRVLFVIDALNQLDETDNAQSLHWLPWNLPANVRIIASCIDDRARDEPVLTAFKRHKRATLKINPLTSAERLEIVRQVPSLSAKTLDSAQVRLLMENPATANPLYLLTALEELRGFGSFQQLNERIKALPWKGDAVAALFRQVIERLETDFGRRLTRSVFTVLASARRGLSQSELQAVAESDERADSLFAVLRQARPYLQPRGNLIDFFHRGLYKAVRQKYLRTDEQQIAAHRRLAEYFRRQLNPQGAELGSGDDQRAVAELPHHQTLGQCWDELEATLCELRYVEAKCRGGMTFDLVDDYVAALRALPELQAEQQREADRVRWLRQYGADLVAYAKARGEGVPLPEPPDTEPVKKAMKRAEQARRSDSGGAHEDTRAARLQRFASFVFSNSHTLHSDPDLTCVQARNHARDGAIVTQAECQLAARSKPWLSRDPRPPAPSIRPECIRKLVGHTRIVSAVAMTPDGSLAVSGGMGRHGIVRVWDVHNGACFRTLECAGLVKDVAITSDGKLVVTASGGGMVRVWDVQTGANIRTLEAHEMQNSVAIVPDASLAVSAGHDGVIFVWNVSRGVCFHKLTGHTQPCNAVAITADGKTAVSGSSDGSVRVWDISTGACKKTLDGHARAVDSVCVTLDGKNAITSGYDGARVWDLRTGACLSFQEGGSGIVAISADGKLAASKHESNFIRELATGTCIRTISRVQANAVAITPDCRIAVTGSLDGDIRVWDLQQDKFLKAPEEHTNSITDIVVTPDGKHAVSASEDKTLHVSDAQTGKCIKILKGHTVGVFAVALAANGTTAVSASFDKTVRVWDLPSGACVRTLEGHVMPCTAVGITPDGRRAVSGGYDKTVRLWDLKSGVCVRSQEFKQVYAAATTRDGQFALLATEAPSIFVLEIHTGSFVRVLKGHESPVSDVTIAADGKTAVSASWDKTVRAWDLGTGACIAAFTGHTDLVAAAAITPNGRRLASTGWDKTVRVWDLATRAAIAVHHLESQGLSVAAISNERFVAGTRSGQLHFLDLRKP